MVKGNKIISVILAIMMIGCTNTQREDTAENDDIHVNASTEKYEFQKLEFSKFEKIPSSSFIMFHGIMDDILYFSYGEATNSTIYSTNALYSYELKTHQVNLLKDIQNEYRVWDFVLLDNGDLLYSKVDFGNTELDPFRFEIVKEKNGIETVLDEGSLFNYLNSPAFSKAGEKIFYLLQEVEFNTKINMAEFQVDSLNEITKEDDVLPIWTSHAEVKDQNISEGEEVLVSTNPHYSDSIAAFYTQKASSGEMESTLYYYQFEELKQLVFNERIDSIIPLTNYIVVNTRTSSYVVHAEDNTIKEMINLGMKIHQGTQISKDQFIYYNEDGVAFVMDIDESGIDISKVYGMKNGFLPRFLTDVNGNIIASGYTLDNEDAQTQIVELYYFNHK